MALVAAALGLGLSTVFGIGVWYGRLAGPLVSTIASGAATSVTTPSGGPDAAPPDQASHDSLGGFSHGGGGGH